MSALLDIEASAIAPTVLPNVSRLTPSNYAPRLLSTAVFVSPPVAELVPLIIVIPDLNFSMETDVAEFRQDKYAGQVFIRVAIDTNVDANIRLAGQYTHQGASFEIDEVSFRVSPTEDRARTEFAASTLNAALNLSHKVQFQLPIIGLDVTLGFDLPLIEISRLLQGRQTSYRLMTIERATGIQLDLPSGGFSGADIDAITFVFRAIVDRTFNHHLIKGIPITVQADSEGASRLRSLHESRVIRFGPETMSRQVLGVEIPLGPMTVRIEDLRTDEIERVRDEVAKDDGHLVTVLMRSATNQAVFELPEAPRLPKDPWDRKTQSLINLEGPLDSQLLARYNALAAGSLAGLTDKQKKRVTTRPQLRGPSLLSFLRDKLGL